MATDDEIAKLRAEGLTPKLIAKRLGLRQAEVTTAIQRLAAAAPPVEQAFVAAWVSAHWTAGLGFADAVADWRKYDIADHEHPGAGGLVQVLVVREGRHGHVVVAGYLCDLWCLGVKNAIGPRTMTQPELKEYAERYFGHHEGAGLIPLEVAQAIVLGSEAYARSLGFEPHADFARARGLLGTDAAPAGITFGRNGEPSYVGGPDDDAATILATLAKARAVGSPP